MKGSNKRGEHAVHRRVRQDGMKPLVVIRDRRIGHGRPFLVVDDITQRGQVVVLAVSGGKADPWHLKDGPGSVNFCVRNKSQFQGAAEPFADKVAPGWMIQTPALK